VLSLPVIDKGFVLKNLLYINGYDSWKFLGQKLIEILKRIMIKLDFRELR